MSLVTMKRACAGALGLAIGMQGASAWAQSAAAEPPVVDGRGPDSSGVRGDLPDTSWRGGTQDRLRRKGDPDFTFEFRFGPYWPQIDDEFGDDGPYERIFDNDAQFYFGLELDWTPIRIPYVGKIGPGIGWGITPATGKGRDPDTDEPTDVDTSLTIMPMHVSAVLRVDELLRRTDVPLAPYGKLGFGFATWSASTSAGTSEAACDPSDPARRCEAEDTTLGIHAALGVALALDWVDEQRAKNLQDMGIGHLYLFGEWMHAALNGIGSRPQMQVGTSTFVGGVSLDF